MPSGFSTQAVILLLPDVPTQDSLAAALRPMNPRRLLATAADPSEWIGANDTWVIKMEGQHGRGAVDISLTPRPWPDHMGDPQAEPMLFGAWATGFLGPHTFPGNLSRAKQFAALAQKHQVAARAEAHASFIILRSTHAHGAADSDAIRPTSEGMLADMQAVTQLASRLAQAFPGAVWFCPGGETLFDAGELPGMLDRHESRQELPLALWCNTRIFNLSPNAPGWTMLDTVGFNQFDAPDHEACFTAAISDLSAVQQFLLNIGEYVRCKGSVIKHGDTSEGAGHRWQAGHFKNGLTSPPREVIRWLPIDGRTPPAMLTARQD